MIIERDEWLYVHTTTPERAREFFRLPPTTEVRQEPNGCFAVRAAEDNTRKGAPERIRD